MSAIDNRSVTDLDVPPPARVGLGIGLKAPLKGVAFIARRPDLWILAAVPAAVALLVATGLGTASVTWLPDLAAWLIGPTTTWYGDVGAAIYGQSTRLPD